MISATYGWVNPSVSIHLGHLSGICRVVCSQWWGIYHERSSQKKGIFLVEFTCNILYHFEKGKYLSNYNCMKLVAPSPLSICSFPKWYWGRIDGHAWNGLSKPLKFCRKFTSMLIGILQINYCPREIPRRHSTSNSRVYLPPQGSRPEGEIPRRHSSNSRVY